MSVSSVNNLRMKRQYEQPALELLYMLMEDSILSEQIDPGHEVGDDDY